MQTYVWLAKCCPPETKAEEQLIEFYMDKRNRDVNDVINIHFFNDIISKRQSRGDYRGAQVTFAHFCLLLKG